MKQSHRVLIAFDGSPQAEAAVRDLPLAGLGARVSARVVTVCDPRVSLSEALSANLKFLGASAPSLPDPRERQGEARRAARRGADKVRDLFPGWSVSTATPVAAPARGLLDEARRWKPTLIVVGSRIQDGLERLVFGSVSDKVLTHATCGVRIARGRSTVGAGLRIVVAVDGSQPALRMVRQVAARAWPGDARFLVVTALDYGFDRRHPEPREREAAAKMAEEAAAILTKAGLNVRAAVREGDARLEIPKAIRSFRANTLFVGRRGLHADRLFLLGGVSSHLARHARCTVEVVRS